MLWNISERRVHLGNGGVALGACGAVRRGNRGLERLLGIETDEGTVRLHLTRRRLMRVSILIMRQIPMLLGAFHAACVQNVVGGARIRWQHRVRTIEIFLLVTAGGLMVRSQLGAGLLFASLL